MIATQASVFLALAVAAAGASACGTSSAGGPPSASSLDRPDQLPPPPPPPPEVPVNAYGIVFPLGLKVVRTTSDMVVVDAPIPSAEMLAYIRERVAGGVTEVHGPTTILDRVHAGGPGSTPELPLRVEVTEVSSNVTRVTVIAGP